MAVISHWCAQRFDYVFALAALLVPYAVKPAHAQSTAEPSPAGVVRPNKPDARKAQRAFERALQAEREENWAAAFAAYAEAATYEPANADRPRRREAARFRLVQQHVDRAEREALAGRMPQAREELRAALRLDPDYSIARERLVQLETSILQSPQQSPPDLAGPSELQPKPGTRDFNYRGDVRGAYETVARQFGVTALFDSELRAQPVRFRVTGVDFETAMTVLGQQTNTFWRALDAHTFLVAENTTQKRRDYAPVVVRTFILPNSTTPDKMTETLRLVREIAGVTHTELDMRSRTLTLRDTSETVAVAAALIQELGQAPAEMMLEIDILEVDRTVARRLGITPPSTTRLITISSDDIRQARQATDTAALLRILSRLLGRPASLASAGGLGTLVPPIVAVGGGESVFLITVPGAAADFAESLNLVRRGRRVLLRALDGQPATFFVGDRFPITLAQLGAGLVPGPIPPLVSPIPFPRRDFEAGTGPVGVAIGDLNRDGQSDLAVVNRAANSVSALLGNGDGSFRPKTDFPTGNAPSAVAIADLNAAGGLDLAITNQTDNNVSILLGNGDGSFQSRREFPTGNGPIAVAMRDLSGDGAPDLVIANQTDNNVSILLGNGDGSFLLRTDFPTGNGPSAVAIADFNGDGRSDLAITNQADDTISILLGNGDGTFLARRNFPTGTTPVAIATADFNGDRIVDLAVANRASNTVSILLGNADGSFRARRDFPTGANPVAIATADFSLDGRPDVGVTNQGANTVSVLLGLGDGQLATGFDLPTGRSPSSLAAADLNGDSRPDLAITNEADNSVSVILNTLAAEGITPPGVLQTPYPGSQYEDLGLKVRATPRIHLSNEVTLQLQFESRTLSGVSLNGIPIISNRTVEQTVRLQENESTLLAGIVQKDEVRAITGLPGFARTLAIGHLAGQRNTEQRDTELLIVITPRRLRLAPRADRPIYAGRGTGSTAERPQTTPP